MNKNNEMNIPESESCRNRFRKEYPVFYYVLSVASVVFWSFVFCLIMQGVASIFGGCGY